MTQEKLIEYGFKRVIEELQKNREILEKIEMNTRTTVGETIEVNKWLKSIDNDLSITMSGVQEAKQLVKGIAKHGGLEKQE